MGQIAALRGQDRDVKVGFLYSNIALSLMLKQELRSFLLEESGAVDKDVILRAGSMIIASAIASGIAHAQTAGTTEAAANTHTVVLPDGSLTTVPWYLSIENNQWVCRPEGKNVTCPSEANITAGNAELARQTSLAAAVAATGCPSCQTGCGQPACHANCADIHTDAVNYIGQHTHRIEPSGPCPPPLPAGGDDGGWIMDAIGTAYAPGIHNNGEVFGALIIEASKKDKSFLVDCYHASGVIFRIKGIKHIQKGGMADRLRRWIAPKHDLAKDDWWAKPLLTASARFGWIHGRTMLTATAKDGLLAPITMRYLENMDVSMEWPDHVKRLNALVGGLERGDDKAGLAMVLGHKNYLKLKKDAINYRVSTDTTNHIGSRDGSILLPNQVTVRWQEKFWDLVLRSCGLSLLTKMVYNIQFKRACGHCLDPRSTPNIA